MTPLSFTLMVSPLSLQFSGKRMFFTKGRPRFFKTKAASDYTSAIGKAAAGFLPPVPFAGPLVVDFTFILPRPGSLNRKKDPEGLIPCTKRPDRDNLQKGTQDALAAFWLDDGQIFDGRTTKFYAEKDGQPRIVVRIEEVSL